MTHETIDQKISAKRAELRALKNQEARLGAELAALFKEKAQRACPIPLGTKVQYRDGRWGVLTRIGFFVDFLRILEESAPVHWTVEGTRINEEGEPGVKGFPALGPATHTLNGTTSKPKAVCVGSMTRRPEARG
jgi:hypothetical protein